MDKERRKLVKVDAPRQPCVLLLPRTLSDRDEIKASQRALFGYLKVDGRRSRVKRLLCVEAVELSCGAHAVGFLPLTPYLERLHITTRLHWIPAPHPHSTASWSYTFDARWREMIRSLTFAFLGLICCCGGFVVPSSVRGWRRNFGSRVIADSSTSSTSISSSSNRRCSSKSSRRILKMSIQDMIGGDVESGGLFDPLGERSTGWRPQSSAVVKFVNMYQARARTSERCWCSSAVFSAAKYQSRRLTAQPPLLPLLCVHTRAANTSSYYVPQQYRSRNASHMMSSSS